MSTATLKRELKNTGTTFIDIRQRARLESAKHLLEQTERKVVDIASSLGFSEATTFKRYFKKMIGQTPDQWRRDQ
jgi:AraC-like DNA-binding protein